jgi:hypothetical protein
MGPWPRSPMTQFKSNCPLGVNDFIKNENKGFLDYFLN